MGSGASATIPAGFSVNASGLTLGSLNLEGTLYVDGSCTIENLTISGNGRLVGNDGAYTVTIGASANLSGNASLEINTLVSPGAIFHWNGGAISRDFSAPAGSIVEISGTATEHRIYGGTWNLNGVTEWNAGTIHAVGQDVLTTINIGGNFAANGTTTLTKDPYVQIPVNILASGNFLQQSGTTTVQLDHWFASGFFNNGTINISQNASIVAKSGPVVLENNSHIIGAGVLKIDGAQLYLAPETTSEVNGTIELADGWMEGDGALTGTGTFNWTGGSLGITQAAYQSPRPATLNIPSTMTLNIYGDVDKRLGGSASSCTPCHRQHGVIKTAGTTNWSGNGKILSGYGGGEIINSGTFNASADSEISILGDGGTFTNSAGGTFKKTAGSLTKFPSGFGFVQAGTVNVGSGVVELAGGATFSDGNVIEGAGRLLTTSRSYLSGTTTINGASPNGGTWEHRSDRLLVGNETTPTGTIATADAGKFEWTGGSISGPLYNTGSNFQILGDTDKGLGYFAHNDSSSNGLDLYNQGAITWSGAGAIVDQNTGRIHNASIFLVQTNANLGVNQFNNNAGLFRKTSTGTSQILGPFTNSAGTVDVQAGILQATSSLTLNANGVISGSGRFVNTGRALMLGSTTVSGTFEHRADVLTGGDSGTPSGSLVISGSGRIEWTGGRLCGTVDVPAGTTWNLLGSNQKDLGHYNGWADNAVLNWNNSGNIVWEGTGAIVDVNTGRIHNTGTFTVKNDANLGVNQFNNNTGGIFRKLEATGVTPIVGPFNNNGGVIQINAGSLRSDSDLALSHNSRIEGGTFISAGNTSIPQNVVFEDCVFEVRSGTLTGSGGSSASAFFETEGTGLFKLTGGGIAGVSTLKSGSKMEFSGATSKSCSGFTNSGVIDWSGAGALQGNLANHGTMNVTGAVVLDGSLENNGLLNLANGAISSPNNYCTVDLKATGTLRTIIGSAGKGTITGTTANLGGTLNVTFAPSFNPLSGNTFDLFTNIGYNTQFAAITAPSGFSFEGQNPTLGSFRIYTLGPPEIAVKKGSTNLVDGTSTVSFGSVNRGSSKTVTLVVSNPGFNTLSGISASLVGGNAGDFSITAAPPASIVHGGEALFEVDFTPTASGARTTTLRVASNDANENPFDITLSGTGVNVPEIALSSGGSDISSGFYSDFATVNLGTHAELTYTIKNTGTGNLTGIVATTTGTNAADFTVVTAPATTLAPDATTKVKVRFTPSAAGNRQAVLNIGSNDSDENPFLGNLYGQGNPVGEIQVLKGTTNLVSGTSVIGFGEVDVYASKTITVTIKNTGTATLYSIYPEVSDPSGGGFRRISYPASELEPGESTTFKIEFNPQSSGVHTASLEIQNSDSDENPFILSLTGTGARTDLGDLNVLKGSTNLPSNTHVAFDAVALGSSKTVSLTLKNVGTGKLSGISAQVYYGNASDFTITTTPATSLAVNATSTLSVAFTPGAAGSRSSYLYVYSSDTGGTMVFPLTGTGGAATSPEITVLNGTTKLSDGTSALAFGSVNRGKTKTVALTITNSGTAPLAITSTGIIGTGASDYTVTTAPAANVAAGGSTTLMVKFTPAASGSRPAILQIASNDANENPFDLALTGKGVNVPEIAVFNGTTKLSDGTSSLAFGSVNRGSGKTITLTVKNTGTGKLTGIAATLSGTGASDFKVTTAPAATVAAGESTTLKIRFTPSASGARAASLQLASNDSNETPFDLALTGKGVNVPEIAVLKGTTNLKDGESGVEFGSIANGAVKTITLTLKNTGTGKLKGIAATLDGGQVKQFAVSTEPPTTLAAGSTATMKIRFKPTSKGAKTTTLHIASNDSDENPFDITLTGKATAVASEPSLLAIPADARTVVTAKTVDGASHLILTVDPSASPGFKPVIEVSSDLIHWFSGPVYTETLVNNPAVLKVRDRTSQDSGKRYIRVRWLAK